MKYEQIIDDSILYIKEHINEDLTAQNIANYVGYSVFHFCRIFSLITNLTVMEYIRKYRLSIARSELEDNKKIIDVALQYGFETASGFTKSFRKEFGYTPTSYIVRMNNTDSTFIKNIGEVLSPPEIIQKSLLKWRDMGFTPTLQNRILKMFQHIGTLIRELILKTDYMNNYNHPNMAK